MWLILSALNSPQIFFHNLNASQALRLESLSLIQPQTFFQPLFLFLAQRFVKIGIRHHVAQDV